MSVRFGDRATFAVEIGDHESPQLRHVDVWVGGRRLTVDDDVAFVSTVVMLMRRDADRVRAGRLPDDPAPGRSAAETYRLLDADGTEWREQFWLLGWGEILDNVLVYAYLDDADLVFLFTFWRTTHPVPEEIDQPYTARVARDRFVADVDAAAGLLMSAGSG